MTGFLLFFSCFCFRGVRFVENNWTTTLSGMDCVVASLYWLRMVCVSPSSLFKSRSTCCCSLSADMSNDTTEGSHSFPLRLKLEWSEFSLGCRFPDSFYRHVWQLAWRIDIKDEICARIARLDSLHVSCRKERGVRSRLLLCWIC